MPTNRVRMLWGVLFLACCGTTNSAEESDAAQTGRDSSVVDADAATSSDADASTGAVLSGWQLTKSNTGLPGVGLSCDDLPVYQGPSTVPRDTTIYRQKITKLLNLEAGKITIDQSCFRPTQGTTGHAIAFSNAATEDVIIRDSDLDGTAVQDDHDVAFACAVAGHNFVLQRNRIFGWGCGFWARGNKAVLAEGNYVYGLRSWGEPATNGSHSDGATIRDYSGPLMTIRNNRIDADAPNTTGAFFIQAWAGFIDHMLIEGNLFEGGGYQLILETNNHDYGNDMRALNNRFSKTGFGASYYTGGPGWSEWQDNFVNAPGQPDNKGQVVKKP